MPAINLPWYKESNYRSLQKLRIGDPSFRPTYQSWLINTKSLEDRITGLGGKVVRFNVVTEEYMQWANIQLSSPEKPVDVTSYVVWQSHQSAIKIIKPA